MNKQFKNGTDSIAVPFNTYDYLEDKIDSKIAKEPDIGHLRITTRQCNVATWYSELYVNIQYPIDSLTKCIDHTSIIFLGNPWKFMTILN